jgi:hypothetical protein
VQRVVRGSSHCEFTTAEEVDAFAAMVKWESEGVKPYGDEVLDPKVVSAANYSCKFTNNTFSADEMAAAPATSIVTARKAAPPCPNASRGALRGWPQEPDALYGVVDGVGRIRDQRSWARSRRRAAQANSRANRAMPATTTGMPGPGSGMSTKPSSTTAPPATAMATFLSVFPIAPA